MCCNVCCVAQPQVLLCSFVVGIHTFVCCNVCCVAQPQVLLCSFVVGIHTFVCCNVCCVAQPQVLQCSFVVGIHTFVCCNVCCVAQPQVLLCSFVVGIHTFVCCNVCCVAQPQVLLCSFVVGTIERWSSLWSYGYSYSSQLHTRYNIVYTCICILRCFIQLAYALCDGCMCIAGGEIPVPHIPTLLLVCCCHSTPDSSEISCRIIQLTVHGMSHAMMIKCQLSALCQIWCHYTQHPIPL